MSDTLRKIVIIGAGAAGLTAAISQCRKGRDVTVFERKEKAGLKLAITGNGKCNFTNAQMSPAEYYETEESRLAAFLRRYSYKDAIDYMKSIGIEATEKTGYYYPSDQKAQSVVDALLSECKRLNVNIKYNTDEIDILDLRNNFDAVIIACGSRAHKETGSNGSGYKFLEHLGIKYSRILPALCAINLEKSDFLNEYKGKRLIGTITYNDNKQTGEIQINETNISGIPVLNISRFISKDIDAGRDTVIKLDFEPDIREIPEIIKARAMETHTQVPKQEIKVSKISSFDKSQVCTGGVSLDDLTDDFEVKDVPGVYVIGEMCDVDGMCGGYNLHWAWLSGNLCAE